MKQHDSNRVNTSLTKYLRPEYSRMAMGLFIKFSGTIMDLFIPWILAHIIDDIVPTRRVSFILLWGLIMMGCSVLAVIANVKANQMASRVARDATKKVRHDLFQKFNELSCKQMDDFTLPSLISRITSDTYNVHQMLGMMQRLGVRAPIIVVGGIIVTLMLDPVLALVLIAVLPFISFIVIIISKKGIPLYNQLQGSIDRMVRIVRENITGVRVIKALSKTEYEKERFSRINREVVDNEKRAGLNMALTNPMMNFLLNAGLAVVILVGAYRVNDGIIQAGVIIAFLTYFTLILNSMLSVTRIFMLLSKGISSFHRIAAVLDTESDLELEEENIAENDAHIEFEHVSFSYYKNEDNLTDIHFRLRKGETLGIIGATGSGKSTVIKLLLRLYQADSGCIRIYGRNINSIPSKELNRMVGVAFQNDILLADTIDENIAFGRDIEKEEIIKVSKYAAATEFIEELEKKWKYKLTPKGSNLSGGQKQRLLLARALYGSPEILILDDATSALDYKTEAGFRKALRLQYGDTTTLIVAQRISSLMGADHILVLDDGKMIGYGNHEYLLENCGTYQEMYRLQMGGVCNE